MIDKKPEKQKPNNETKKNSCSEAQKIRLNYELLQDSILKLLLSGQVLKPADTVYLARALKEIATIYPKIIGSENENEQEEDKKIQHHIADAMRVLGLSDLQEDASNHENKKARTPKQHQKHVKNKEKKALENEENCPKKSG